MAVQFTHAGGRERSARARRRRPPMSEINVTPFVDVMLVLLIVFMIAAPLLTVGVEVDLPEADVPEVEGSDEPLAVSVDAEGRIFLQDTELALEELGPRLVAISQNNPDVRIFVRGDEAIEYGNVMAVMGALNQAGFNNVALITRLPTVGEP
ncbi:MAG: protein TolR [Pseudomonadota bacterium]